jgi:hypothetical protein
MEELVLMEAKTCVEGAVCIRKQCAGGEFETMPPSVARVVNTIVVDWEAW